MGEPPTTGLQLLEDIECLRICTFCSVFGNFERNLNLVKTLHLDLCSLLKEGKETQSSHTEKDPAVQLGLGNIFIYTTKNPVGIPWVHGCQIIFALCSQAQGSDPISMWN